MRLVVVASLFFVSHSVYGDEIKKLKSSKESDILKLGLLCADQSDNRIRIVNPFAVGDRKPEFWSYPSKDQQALKYMPTDAKRVEVDGVVHVLAAYHGRVQLIRFSDSKVVKDFRSYSSCHSAELLPDGVIVTANSNHGILRLHRAADDFTDLKVPYAHGVAWDKTRRCLWALGDVLYRLKYSGGNLVIEKKFKLPLSPTGHDLFPLREEAKLLVSDNDALYLFDITTEKFEIISKLHGIKSASQYHDGTIWISDPANMQGAADWQSDAVIQIHPKNPKIRYRNEGARFYKARWWQEVDFSF